MAAGYDGLFDIITQHYRYHKARRLADELQESIPNGS
jgi:hypothetical protein